MKNFYGFFFFILLVLQLFTFKVAGEDESNIDRIEEVDEYLYDPVGRRDPFKPWRTFSSKKAVSLADPSQAKVVEIVDPLLKYDLERYTIIGIMWDVGRPRALIRDPDGKSHLVYKNDRLGRNAGYIQNVREGELVVVEKFEVDGVQRSMTKLLMVRNKEASSSGQ